MAQRKRKPKGGSKAAVRRPKDLSHISPQLQQLAEPISGLQLDPNNARRHPDINMRAIQSSLRRFGQQKPIVVDADGVIVAGNGTVEAAREMGWKTIAVVRTELRGKEAMAFALADNRTAELAAWDEAALARQLEALDEDARRDAGFADGFFDQLMQSMAKDLQDEPAPEPVPEAVAKVGQLWQLGEHRLLCGDCTDADQVKRLFGGQKPFLMVTDPPYGVDYDPNWRIATLGNQARRGSVSNDHRADWTEAWKLFPGVVAYIWHGALHALEVADSLARAGFLVRASIVWIKDRAVISRGHYHWQHEPCFEAELASAFDNDRDQVHYAAKRHGTGAKWHGGRRQTTVWAIEGERNVSGHGSQKPLECMARPIRNHGSKADIVYDPFGGSGGTLIAAEQLGRRCFTMDIEPRWCEAIVRRWEKLTSKTAKLITD